MFSRLLRNATAASLAVVAIGCASTHGGGASTPRGGMSAAAAGLPGTSACFWLRNVFDWKVLNNSELLVHAPLTQNAYLVKLFLPVIDLDFRLNIGFDDADRNGMICGRGLDYLVVPQYAPPRIVITAVQALTAPEQVQLLRAANKPVPRTLLKQAAAGPN